MPNNAEFSPGDPVTWVNEDNVDMQGTIAHYGFSGLWRVKDVRQVEDTMSVHRNRLVLATPKDPVPHASKQEQLP